MDEKIKGHNVSVIMFFERWSNWFADLWGKRLVIIKKKHFQCWCFWWDVPFEMISQDFLLNVFSFPIAFEACFVGSFGSWFAPETESKGLPLSCCVTNQCHHFFRPAKARRFWNAETSGEFTGLIFRGGYHQINEIDWIWTNKTFLLTLLFEKRGHHGGGLSPNPSYDECKSKGKNFILLLSYVCFLSYGCEKQKD